MQKFFFLSILIVTLLTACSKEKSELIDENKLGIIDANVESEETYLKAKAQFLDDTPGRSTKIQRAFENAPPLIPHTTDGFLPIKINNNICQSCHLPDKAEEVGAVPVPESHFTEFRPKLINKEQLYSMSPDDELTCEKMKDFNNAFFNCTQCHVGQTRVSVDIKNLFTPEFRKEFDLEKSNLIEKISEGVK